MIILAIDPGPERSGWVCYDRNSKELLAKGLFENYELLSLVRRADKSTHCAIEMIASSSYGMAVGASVFATCRWVKRFEEAWEPGPPRGDDAYRRLAALVYRRDVKMHLCGSPRAKDANVRQALMDRYGSTRQKAIGTKKNPGPLYGVKKDIWAALGVAITYAETR